MNTPPPERPAPAAPLRATAIANSHATSYANAQPNNANTNSEPQVHTTQDHAPHIHHRSPAGQSPPNRDQGQNGQSAQNSHVAPPPPPIVLPPASSPTPLVAPYTPSSMLLAPGPPPAPSSDIGDEDVLDLNGGPISPHSPPIPTVTPTAYLAAPNGTHCSCPHDEVGRVGLLLRTVDFAAWKHQCQRRKDLDQTPYINHPIAVATLLSSTGITDIHVLQAAVLHDTVEDTNTSIGEIERTFGPEVASIVQECTDDTTLNGLERKIEQLRTAPFKSREAQQVKLADKLHNLDSIRRSPPLGWTVQRIQGYFKWAKQVTDVCAHAHPPLAARLQTLYETAYTRVNGEYFPCHPDVCGPLTEAEKSRVDQRFAVCGAGDQPCPHPIFF